MFEGFRGNLSVRRGAANSNPVRNDFGSSCNRCNGCRADKVKGRAEASFFSERHFLANHLDLGLKEKFLQLWLRGDQTSR